MATPVTVVLAASQRVAFIRDDGQHDESTEGFSEECALTVTYQLAEDDNLETIVKEKAAEIGALHADVQKGIRLARAEHKAGCICGPDAGTEHSDGTTKDKPPTKFGGSTPPFQPNGNGGQSITGPQRIVIEEHFRRLAYTEQDILAHVSGRFAKSRLIDLSMRQASDLLSELQRMSIDPARASNPNEPIHIPLNGRRGSKRSGH